MGDNSGFILPPKHVESQHDFHDLQLVRETELSRLTMAVRGGRRWMLKSLPERLRDDAMHQALQQKEYDILCRLSHPSIVSVVEMADVPTLGRCIVMEYVDGITLDELHADKKTRRHLALRLAEAVAYIHSHQVVHRDLKPTNIMVTHNGTNIKIIDFGLADTDAHTILKQPAGTPGYMSVEQQMESRPDVRNDIYSLGILFCQLHLGLPYRKLLSHMTCSLDRRTSNMDEVMRMMAQAERKPSLYLLFFVAMLCVVSVSFYLFLINSETTALDANICPAETLTVEPDTMRNIHLESAQTISAPIQTAVTSLPTEGHAGTTKSAEANCSEVALVRRGKTLLDAYLQQHHFEEMADTIQIPGPGMTTLGEIFLKAQAMVMQYADTCSADADVQQNVRKQVDEYIVYKYWRPYHGRVQKILN